MTSITREPKSRSVPSSHLFFSQPSRDTPSITKCAAAVAAAHAVIAALLFWFTVRAVSPLPTGLMSLPIVTPDLLEPTISVHTGTPVSPTSTAPKLAARTPASSPPRPVTQPDPGLQPLAQDRPLLGQPIVPMPSPPPVVPTTIPEPAWRMPPGDVFARNPAPSGVPVAVPGTGASPSATGANNAGSPTVEDLARGEPRFTPFTQAPELINRSEVRSFLQTRYPPQLSARGMGGQAVLWILIDEQGGIRKAVLLQSSGNATLDNAALEAIDRMEFRPAINQGKRVPVWVQLPITFQPR